MPRPSERPPPKVLVAGTFAPGFARNRVVLAMLERGGCDVRQVREELWGDRRYGLIDEGKARLLLKGAAAYVRLTWRLLRTPRPDVAVVLYPGYFDMPLVGLIGRLRRFPVVFDIFISLHDTLTGDRDLRSPDSLMGRASRLADQVACRSASLVVADTPTHAGYFSRLTGVPRERFRVLWLGAQESVFSPVADAVAEPRLVVFHGTFIPLQGLETIVRAAKLLEDDDIRFRIIGDGQERDRVERLVAELGVPNVELVGMLPLEDLPLEISRASLCLGIFGTTKKAGRVVPNKLYEALAVGRPVLTADTDAIRSAFDGEVATVPPGDPDALAAAIRELLDDPERLEELAAAGHARFSESYSETALTGTLMKIIDEVLHREQLERR